MYQKVNWLVNNDIELMSIANNFLILIFQTQKLLIIA